MERDNENSSETFRVLIAASGSGGHLMPARLIGEALLELGAEISFVGSGRPLEKEIFGSLDVPLYTVPIEGLNKRGVIGLLKFLIMLPRALFVTRSILRESRADAVIGVGGYASVLPIILGSFSGCKSWIHEAELSPGNANKLLKRFADKISLAFEEAQGFPREKTVFTGHPLRKDVAQLVTEGNAPSDEPKNILILGGSQGARALDEAAIALVPFLKERGLSLYHQCRPENLETLTSQYKALEFDCRVVPFIHELGEAYRWSDIIICRAGAGTVMEVGAVGRPAILVPFPHAQGKHQHKNAQTLVEKGRGVMVEEGEGFQDRVRSNLQRFLETGAYSSCRQAVTASRPTDASENIARGVMEL